MFYTSGNTLNLDLVAFNPITAPWKASASMCFCPATKACRSSTHSSPGRMKWMGLFSEEKICSAAARRSGSAQQTSQRMSLTGILVESSLNETAEDVVSSNATFTTRENWRQSQPSTNEESSERAISVFQVSIRMSNNIPTDSHATENTYVASHSACRIIWCAKKDPIECFWNCAESAHMRCFRSRSVSSFSGQVKPKGEQHLLHETFDPRKASLQSK
mmetsp:Transcript_11307/g.26193  ORF Transcript_11307/g.26193 Transcript_11307/m.26193 type:complete len:218 (-) Transcript_11307:638-1291(-)